MLKFRKILAAFLISVVGIGAARSLPVYAYEKDQISKTIVQSQIFGVPGGGWSSIRAQVSYTEYYKQRGLNNEFTSRSAAVLYSASGATVTPMVVLGNVNHSFHKSFDSWRRIPILFGGDWNGGFGRENTESIVYSSETGAIGKLSFFFHCRGGIPAVVPGSVDLPLRTR